MNFSAYRNRELQNFISMLTQCEAEGVTDVRFVRERLQRHIEGQARYARVERIKQRKMAASPDVCPSCGKGFLVTLAEVEGLKRVGCGKCRYSMVMK